MAHLLHQTMLSGGKSCSPGSPLPSLDSSSFAQSIRSIKYLELNYIFQFGEDQFLLAPSTLFLPSFSRETVQNVMEAGGGGVYITW